MGDSLINFIDHMMNDINAEAHLKFADGAEVHELPMHYVVGNNIKNKEACYISAHGNSESASYGIMTATTFEVPAGCQVLFTTPHGYTVSLNNNALRTGRPLKRGDRLRSGGRAIHGMEFKEKEQCTNYILSKLEGRHTNNEEDAMEAAEENGLTYAAMQSIAAEADIIMVSVRNRWWSANVSLEDTIAAVRGLAPNITVFICLFCRVGDDKSLGDWDPKRGKLNTD